MKGVILAGGTGSRLFPLTRLMNKHLLPVGRQPMIVHAVQKLKDAGIHDIHIVLSKQSAGMYTDYLGSGAEWGVRLSYIIQEQASGIAQALSHVETFLSYDEKLVVLLGDNLFEDSLQPHVESFIRQGRGARVILKEVVDPRRYGVPILNGNKIVHIEEKPEHPQSSYCVTGIYMYDMTVFTIIHEIKPSERGELEITDVNNAFAHLGLLSYDIMDGWWTDAGTFESLREADAELGKRDQQ
ncbi:MAG: sugar phosphate nucleotidyltransferase [Paenibacillaceae bacterium]